MPAIAITGSIGSGKSLVLKTLAHLLHAETFSADEENKVLLDSDDEVKKLIQTQFGEKFYQQDGSADRKALFSLISQDSKARTILESILHPRLQARWKPEAEKFFHDQKSFFIAEIPLLYEKGLDVFFDKTIVVECSDAVRRVRLQQFRSISAAETDAWLNIQSSQILKAIKADYLLWNDGSLDTLDRQIKLLVSHFRQS
ncbi:MAG: dephospho-CoA kinase [bacterium]